MSRLSALPGPLVRDLLLPPLPVTKNLHAFYSKDRRFQDWAHSVAQAEAPMPSEFSWGSVVIARRGRLMAVVTLDSVVEMEHGRSMQVSVATEQQGRWLTRGILSMLHEVIFEHFRVSVAWAHTSRKNKKARRLLEKLGCKLEGVHRLRWDGKTDAVVYSMTREEAERWIMKPSPRSPSEASPKGHL